MTGSSLFMLDSCSMLVSPPMEEDSSPAGSSIGGNSSSPSPQPARARLPSPRAAIAARFVSRRHRVLRGISRFNCWSVIAVSLSHGGFTQHQADSVPDPAKKLIKAKKQKTKIKPKE